MTARAAWASLTELWKGGDPDLGPLLTAKRELARFQAAAGR